MINPEILFGMAITIVTIVVGIVLWELVIPFSNFCLDRIKNLSNRSDVDYLTESVKYYEQRGVQLEEIIVQLGLLLKENKIQFPIFMQGISGDELLNDIGEGVFYNHILERIEEGK